jgi:hypothetical protein
MLGTDELPPGCSYLPLPLPITRKSASLGTWTGEDSRRFGHFLGQVSWQDTGFTLSIRQWFEKAGSGVRGDAIQGNKIT